jgi:hypothetical protein
MLEAEESFQHASRGNVMRESDLHNSEAAHDQHKAAENYRLSLDRYREAIFALARHILHDSE